ncbi:lipopolysaccharide kinase (Kdo/WaaP) family protein [Flavobacterium limicola]|uniref:Lipopolysaccharide kinase (Kdo/WaaP) family protein n=1 Tax=Flavobacterium limicola TaxID=180441 RepID=A0A495RZB7_9FLAO|nr:lipopolysaccharide kinase InaA family protein [Flavobacterium limicola]RKS92426.1 lipopolysaccharide kinase (Kdo/WaaP) family protein [Flavobacterium limicola]
MQIIIHPQYIHQENSILQLVAGFFVGGDLIVKGSRNTIKSNILGDEKVNIKYFDRPGLIKSIIYSFFRSTKAKRSFDYANYLLAHNIPTPFPIAYVENRNRWGLLGDSFYICQQIDYDFTIRELIHDPLFNERNLILEQFTAFTYKMHEGKVKFLDHSPGNTLVVKKDSGKYDFYLIDLNRMKFEDLSIEARMDNFKKMWLSKTMVKVVAKAYAKLSNQSEEKLHSILLEKTTQFKRKITKKKYLKRKIGKK